ncbi:MAG: FG-GAP repeat domain-containing protein, partial [Bryobacteraceae bacterium]
LKVRIRLAEELLLAGETAESIAELDRIRTFAEARGMQLTAAFRRQLRDLNTLAFLRLGEQENCVLHQGIESCLMPIRNSGVHQRRRGSMEAIKGLREALEEAPDDLLARWLLNIAYMTLGEHPRKVPTRWLIPLESFESEYDIGRFTDVASDLGVNVLGLAGGSVMEDFDSDGFLDLMVSSSGLNDQLRYFRNNGDGTFIERTAAAGLAGLTGGLNLIHADFNNDGHRDVFVLRGAWMGSEGHYPNSLLRNNGDGTFDDVTERAGILSFHPTQTAAWGDFDNDGWLDLFVGNESQGSEKHPCELYRNNGDGTFTDVAERLGVANLGYVKGVAWGDYDNDGRLDLYVSRLGASNLLFRNHGDGFTDVTRSAGVHEPIYSFATWFWDYDNDGWQDLFVAAFHTEKLGDIAAVHLGLPSAAERPRLFRNNRDGSFTDVTAAAGLDRVVLTMGANFGDLDNDGFLDCYLGTGEPDYRALLPNRMFRNAGGKRFQDVTTSGGFGHLQKGHAISFGDLDNDGDQDVYAVMGGAFPGDAFRNVLFANPGHGNSWITLDLIGTRSNRDA